MLKKLILIVAIVMSSISFAGELVGARIIPKYAKEISIYNFKFDQNWDSPVLVVKYKIKDQANKDKMKTKKVQFKIDRDLLTEKEISLIKKKQGFFSSARKQRKLAKKLFNLKKTRSLSGRVLLLELK